MKLEKEIAQIDLDDLNLGGLYLMQEIQVLVDPDTTGAKGKDQEVHTGYLFVKKEASRSDK